MLDKQRVTRERRRLISISHASNYDACIDNEDFDSEAHQTELDEQQLLISGILQSLDKLSDCHEADLALGRLDYALESLEAQIKEGYSLVMESAFQD